MAALRITCANGGCAPGQRPWGAACRVVESEDDVLEHLSLSREARASAAELLLGHDLYCVLRSVNGWRDEDGDRVAGEDTC